MKKLLTFAAVAALTFASYGVYSTFSTPSAMATEQAATKGPIYKLSAVEKAAGQEMMTDFSWKEGDKTVSLSSVGKGKVIFLNFWATWCPPCRKEIPDIVAISKEMKNVVVVGVALERGGTAKLEDFIDKNNISYVNIVSEDNTVLGKLMEAYGGIQYVPTTFIIANGKIVSKIVGGSTKDAFMKEIKKAS